MITDTDLLRDLAADLELCRKATPGPWVLCGGFSCLNGEPVSAIEVQSQGGNIIVQMESGGTYDDRRMIAASREGWPVAIRRAISAELKLQTLGAPHLTLRHITARSPRWPSVRSAHLRREPTCQACGSKANVEVHHVIPVHVESNLELAETNLITLCDRPGRSCHLVFGHLFDWSHYDPDVREHLKVWREWLKGRK